MAEESRSVADLWPEAIARRDELEATVFVRDRCIIIDVERIFAAQGEARGEDYEIDLARCSTHQEILNWTHHLIEKKWMSKALLRQFIQVALKANDLRL